MLSLAALAGCGGDDEESNTAAQETSPAPTTQATEPETETTAEGPVRADGDPEVSTYASGLDAPWELAFLPDGRALVTERAGNVKIVSKDRKLTDAGSVEVEAFGESGLLGLALDPDFEDNDRVYLYRTTGYGNEVSRYPSTAGSLTEDEVVVDGIEAGSIHDGGRIRFGPDDTLYVSTGDAGNATLAQDDDSLNGKILRWRLRAAAATPRSSPRPPQRPGLRLGRRALTGCSTTEFGPDSDDEVNVIRKGSQLRLARRAGRERAATASPRPSPSTRSDRTVGRNVRAHRGSAWSGDYLFGASWASRSAACACRRTARGRDEALFEGELGRMRTVVEGPDGALYALTNNTDGRGSPQQGDDRVIRIVPPRG